MSLEDFSETQKNPIVVLYPISSNLTRVKQDPFNEFQFNSIQNPTQGCAAFMDVVSIKYNKQIKIKNLGFHNKSIHPGGKENPKLYPTRSSPQTCPRDTRFRSGLLKQLLRLAKPDTQRWTQVTKEFIVKGSGYFRESQRFWGSVFLLSLKIGAGTN